MCSISGLVKIRHVLDPCQAADYGALVSWRRVLLRRPDLHACFQDLWSQGMRGRSWRKGPVHNDVAEALSLSRADHELPAHTRCYVDRLIRLVVERGLTVDMRGPSDRFLTLMASEDSQRTANNRQRSARSTEYLFGGCLYSFLLKISI